MPVSVVFGASGAIGSFLVPRLLDEGQQVVAISRTPRATAREGLRWIVAGLPSAVPALPACDAIFSLGPLDAFAEWLARAPIARARVVAIGSLSAVTKARSPDAHERDVAMRLMQAQASIAETARRNACVATVLRASLIYGAGLDRSLTPIVRFAQRWRVFPLAPAANGLRQPVHADDLAAACVALRMVDGSRPTYDVGGGERLAFAAMLARVRASLAFATLPLPVPIASARALSSLLGGIRAFGSASPAALQRTAEDLIVDHAAAAADFGWSPRDFHPTLQDWTPPPLP